MIELIEANWPLFLVALLIGIAVAWLIFSVNRRTKIQVDSDGPKGDVLDEGGAPAARNQALIDTPPASVTPVAPAGLAGAGVAVEAATMDTQPEPAPVPAPDKKIVGDDLTRIKGVGPKLRAQLGELGVVSFDQIAAWTDADIDRIDPQLGRFAGRIRRDDWVTQAKLLGSGDMDAYRAKFGNL